MPLHSGYRTDPRPDFAGSPGTLLTLAAWGAVLAGAVWMWAFGADAYRSGHLSADGAIAHTRELAGSGAVACGVAAHDRSESLLACARRSEREGRRYWFLVSRHGHTMNLNGLARSPNGKTYVVGYSRYQRDAASPPDSILTTATCVGPRLSPDGKRPFSCAEERFY